MPEEITYKNLNAHTAKTTPGANDDLLLFDDTSNEATKIDYDNLADAILNKLTSKTFTNQVGGSSAATLLAQLATLNSNINTIHAYSVSDERFSQPIKWAVLGRICFVAINGNVTVGEAGGFSVDLGENFPNSAISGISFDFIPASGTSTGAIRVMPQSSGHTLHFYKYGNAATLGTRISFCFITAN